MKYEFMQEAIKQAKKAYELDEVPIGAVIVKDNKVIAVGYNQKNKLNNVLKHAEIIAIEQAQQKLNNWRLNDCEIYVTLEPCPMCASAIQQSRIEKVYYGLSNQDEKNKEIIDMILGKSKNNKEVLYESGICEEEINEIMKSFFQKKR